MPAGVFALWMGTCHLMMCLFTLRVPLSIPPRNVMVGEKVLVTGSVGVVSEDKIIVNTNRTISK